MLENILIAIFWIAIAVAIFFLFKKWNKETVSGESFKEIKTLIEDLSHYRNNVWVDFYFGKKSYGHHNPSEVKLVFFDSDDVDSIRICREIEPDNLYGNHFEETFEKYTPKDLDLLNLCAFNKLVYDLDYDSSSGGHYSYSLEHLARTINNYDTPSSLALATRAFAKKCSFVYSETGFLRIETSDNYTYLRVVIKGLYTQGVH